jgi:hypothetical protein
MSAEFAAGTVRGEYQWSKEAAPVPSAAGTTNSALLLPVRISTENYPRTQQFDAWASHEQLVFDLTPASIPALGFSANRQAWRLGSLLIGGLGSYAVAGGVPRQAAAIATTAAYRALLPAILRMNALLPRKNRSKSMGFQKVPEPKDHIGPIRRHDGMLCFGIVGVVRRIAAHLVCVVRIICPGNGDSPVAASRS